METIANILRFAGLAISIAGLWHMAGGMRVVVSGRIDERRRSAKALRLGVPLVVAGVLLLSLGIWLAKWAHL